MSKNKVVGISKARVFPINSRSTYSFKNGNATIDFEISPEQMRLMDTRSLRLNFMLDVLDDATTRNAQNPCRPNNQNTAGTGAKDILIDSRTGVHGIIDTLRISNFKSEVIAEIRNYGHMCASTMTALTSFDAYKNWNSCKSVAFAREDTEGLAVNGTMPCSIELKAGIFNSGQPVSTMMTDGLKIKISLQSDNTFLFDNGGGDAAASNSHYELSKVSLTYNWINLEAPMMPGNENLQFPAYSSFTNIVQSSDDQQSLMMNLKSVRAVFTNFIKTSHLNNFSRNSFQTNRLQDAGAANVPIKNYVHLRNNIKMPKKYEINERIPVTNDVYEAQLGREYLDCFRPFRSIVSTLQSPATQGYKSVDYGDYDHPDEFYVGGLGNNYDMLMIGAGVEFQNSLYALRIQSDLTDSTANTAYTFALSNQGLQVRQQNVQPVQ